MQVTIVTATTKAHLVVVLELGLIWGILFVVDHGAGSLVRVFRKRFSITKTPSFVGVELSSEGIAVVDAENAVIDTQVHGHVQVGPVIALSGTAINGDLMALEEDALR